MRKAVFLLLAAALMACPPIPHLSFVFFNRAGIEIKTPPVVWEKKMKEKLGLDQLYIIRSQGVFYLRISSAPVEKPTEISSSVDLSPWFKNRECAKTWENFHECMNQRKNPQDELLYRKLDLEFYSKLICQETCPDRSFLLWEAHWYSPTYISISAKIGEGGFKSVEEAKESLHRINALLKKVLYGARFPENYGEGRTPMEVFSIRHRYITNPELFKRATREILLAMERDGYLSGLSPEEVEKISSLSGSGKQVLYIPQGCHPLPWLKPGWVSLSNSARVNFKNRCPRIEILR